MHILLIHQAFVSPREAGGTRHFEFARHALKKAHHFTIVASDLSYLTGQRYSSGRSLVSQETTDGIRILRAYTYPALHKSFVWRVISFLSFMVTSVLAGLRAEKVDLVMGTSPPIFQAVSAWMVALLRRKPFILEVRDLWPAFAIDMGILTNPVLIFLSHGLERFLYARARHIIVNSPAYRDYLMKQGIRPGNISLISNGVDIGMFENADGTSFREEWGLDRTFVVTYAGALGVANDIPVILRAAERLKHNNRIRFVLVGDGKERARLQETARRQDLKNVVFTGSRPKSEMPSILAGSDACVATLQDIPMFKTTYPNKVFDYMAAGRPTILGIDGVIRNVVEASKGGVAVPPGDDDALARVVSFLERDRDGARVMGESAKRYAKTHFDRALQAGQFIRLMEALSVRQHPSPKPQRVKAL